MRRTKSISILLSATFIIFNSRMAMAAETTDSGFLPPIWPLLLVIAIMFIFRKQLNCVKPFASQQSDTPAAKEQTEVEAVSADTTPTKQVEAETVTDDTATKIETIVETSNDSINLKDNSSQCQASTAKGTRCKRTTTLEDTSITVDGKTYELTVCKQHNTAALKPFSELLK